MKATVFGLVGGSVVAFVFWSVVGRGVPAAAQPSVYQASGELMALSIPVENDRQPKQQVTLIDPRTRAMSVYHVDAATGTIALKSVRHVEFDLQMIEYNTAEPLPSTVRAQFQK